MLFYLCATEMPVIGQQRMALFKKFMIDGFKLRMIYQIDPQLGLAVLAQMVAHLPLVQQVRGSIPGGVVNFNLKIFNLGARRDADVHFLIARLYITVLD